MIPISAGGKAVSSAHSVTDAHLIIQEAQKAFGGRVDVLLNNAGILRERFVPASKNVEALTTDKDARPTNLNSIR